MDFAKLSQHGYSQEVRLPKKYRLAGERVKISRYGQGVLLEPINKGMETIFDALELFSPDFMQHGRQQPENETRKPLFP